jgi:hypothetical protein
MIDKIKEDVEIIIRNVDDIGYKGSNEFNLHLMEDISDYINKMVKWNNVEDIMPNKNEYVLVHTPFCKYKVATAFWNGVEWRSADNKDEVWNVQYWKELPNTDIL